MKTITLPSTDSMKRSPLWHAFLLIPFVLAWFALAPLARAVDPPPDGGYPNENTAEGQDSLFSLPAGVLGQNTAVGFNAMFNTTSGSENTAVGDMALFSNTAGPGNTAMGYRSLYSNINGIGNVAIGIDALTLNTSGYSNAAVGEDALSFNTTGFYNTAVGSLAMVGSLTGSVNTAVGAKTLAFNSTGHDNTAIGYGALNYNTTGINNVAIGSFAASTYGTNGSNNIVIGYAAGTGFTTGSNNIDIGNIGASSDTGIIRIGTAGIQTVTFIAGIRDTPLADGAAVAVGITADGQLGVRASSARFKESVKPMDKTSEAIFSLQPVTFRYKKDPAALPQFGLIAEEVAKVNPDLVLCDTEGKPFTVRYDEINAMLLNEFLKEHRKVEEQQATIAELKSTVAQQQKGMDALTVQLRQQAVQIQEVSAQLELSKSAPQTVLNNQ